MTNVHLKTLARWSTTTRTAAPTHLEFRSSSFELLHRKAGGANNRQLTRFSVSHSSVQGWLPYFVLIMSYRLLQALNTSLPPSSASLRLCNHTVDGRWSIRRERMRSCRPHGGQCFCFVPSKDVRSPRTMTKSCQSVSHPKVERPGLATRADRRRSTPSRSFDRGFH